MRKKKRATWRKLSSGDARKTIPWTNDENETPARVSSMEMMGNGGYRIFTSAWGDRLLSDMPPLHASLGNCLPRYPDSWTCGQKNDCWALFIFCYNYWEGENLTDGTHFVSVWVVFSSICSTWSYQSYTKWWPGSELEYHWHPRPAKVGDGTQVKHVTVIQSNTYQGNLL